MLSVLPEAVGGKQYTPGQQDIIDRLTTGGVSFPQETVWEGGAGGLREAPGSHLTGNKAHPVWCLVHIKGLPDCLISSQRPVKCHLYNQLQVPQACG